LEKALVQECIDAFFWVMEELVVTRRSIELLPILVKDWGLVTFSLAYVLQTDYV
jgi:hypothetical protein